MCYSYHTVFITVSRLNRDFYIAVIFNYPEIDFNSFLPDSNSGMILNTTNTGLNTTGSTVSDSIAIDTTSDLLT